MGSERAWTRGPGPLHRGCELLDVDARKRSPSRALRATAWTGLVHAMAAGQPSVCLEQKHPARASP